MFRPHTSHRSFLSSMLNPCPHECRYPVPNSSRANPSDNRQLSAPLQHERSLTYQGSANSRDERRCLPRELHPYTGTAPPERLPRLSELNNIPSTETATAQAQRGGLSVYESPTATYMWPRFDPEARPSQSNDSVIYVNYRPSPSLLAPLRNQLSSTASETGSSSTRSGSFECERDSGESHSSWSRKRSSSIESETSPSSPSDRFIKLPRVSQAQTESAGSPRHRATVPSPADFTRSPANGTDRELPVSFDALDIDSDQDHELDEARHPSPSASAHSTQVADEQSSRSSSVSAVTSFPSENSSGGNWMQYAEPPKVPGPMALYTCTWPIDNNFGTIMPCGYTSKRHLVKRHVESKHLQLRPCICPVCGKGFAQKSNLETHMNTHTGQTPHKCPYPNCEEYFKDPARRHRHMKAVHQHVSSRTKKNRMEVTVSAV
ncbi:hypothetical protein WOLCODRAFT_137226 [Wolfiporia cocos MD-104 SS10]|uniref:C2H2-type domain-containing protein n=1 Tax=Wolfiporia cocos (strain MD-104) TaxID=742152 RepID=A0A2H3JG35_WOLCO|nr:hypothetical protein WOLCODRAFT_137226 [Wolfiporia cocos MD-104 SS10]